MAAGNAGVVCPWGELASRPTDHQPAESEDAGHERAGPASAKIRELGDWLGENDLICVALEVAQDRRAEDGGDHDGAEQSQDDIENRGREGAVEQDLVIADVEKILGGDGQEA